MLPMASDARGGRDHEVPSGLTAYERIKGREYSGLMHEFGSVILHKSSAKVQGGVMTPRWMKGLWLGKRFGTEEHVIATLDGAVLRSCAFSLFQNTIGILVCLTQFAALLGTRPVDNLELPLKKFESMFMIFLEL